VASIIEKKLFKIDTTLGLKIGKKEFLKEILREKERQDAGLLFLRGRDK
jgi:hypothetical protein